MTRPLVHAFAFAFAIVALTAAAAAAAAAAPPVEPVTKLVAEAPDNDDGKHIAVTFERATSSVDAKRDVVTIVYRAPARGKPAAPPPPTFDETTDEKLRVDVGDWIQRGLLEGGETEYVDEVPVDSRFFYAVAEYRRDGDGNVVAASPVVVSPAAVPHAAWFHTGRIGFLGIVVLIAGLIAYFIPIAKRRPKDVYIRRMPGVDAIEDAVGRSTEMGRPVLYVTGLEEIQDIQTLASLLILGHVAELTATYDTEIKVANYYPMTMVVAEEIVRQGYANAGRMDAHRPENVMFITAEQFAFAAGVTGLILRDLPATNIYFGKFFGESLLLAETGFLTGAVQIAGTAELAQLPFFVAACDYCLIGEEMYATSAYLSREPTLLANLKAGDVVKLVAMIFILAGAVLATIDLVKLGPVVFP
jgi:hypothetical protein